MNADLSYFDGIVYINLAKREDRNREILEELGKFDLHPNKVFRIEAVYDECNGTRGCVLSHIRALDFAIQKKWNHVLILEDDCIFTKTAKETHSYIQNFMVHFKNQWDVFFLGTKIEFARKTTHENYVQVLFSLRAHAYAVHGSYLCKLKEHYLSTYASMEGDLFFTFSLTKALDRKWVALQMKDLWFSGIQPIAEQRTSFSDIEKLCKPQR